LVKRSSALLTRANSDHSRTIIPAMPTAREGWDRVNRSFSATEASLVLIKGDSAKPKNEARKAISREERRPTESMRAPR
jgi:hypothetical protein